MRIHLKLTKNLEPFPFLHQHLIVGKIHSWIGNNKLHGEIGQFSFSRLDNGRKKDNYLDFMDGSAMFISNWKNDFIKKIVNSIQKDNRFLYGMLVNEIILQETPTLENIERFDIASPVFIKRTYDRRDKHFTFQDKESGQYLTETLHNKMLAAGFDKDESLQVDFDENYQNKKTQLIQYKKAENIIKNRCNWCPVIIQGKPESKQFAWNAGIGNSTGIGFGALI